MIMEWMWEARPRGECILHGELMQDLFAPRAGLPQSSING